MLISMATAKSQIRVVNGNSQESNKGCRFHSFYVFCLYVLFDNEECDINATISRVTQFKHNHNDGYSAL